MHTTAGGKQTSVLHKVTEIPHIPDQSLTKGFPDLQHFTGRNL